MYLLTELILIVFLVISLKHELRTNLYNQIHFRSNQSYKYRYNLYPGRSNN